MKKTSTLASICLTASCFALVTAANVSVGDQPGVFRMTSSRPADETNVEAPPVPPANQGNAQQNNGNAANGNNGTDNLYPVPSDTAPYFGRSFGATQGPPIVSRQQFQRPLFGPQLMFENQSG